MTVKITDKEGKEHEFQTQEEIEATVNEKVEATKKEIAETKDKEIEEITTKHNEALEATTKEVKQLESDLLVAKGALKDADEGTLDWSNARKQITDLENKLETANSDREVDKEEFSKQLRDLRVSIFSDQVELMLDNLSGGDKDLRDKIEHHYNRLNKDVTSEKDAMEVMKDANLLATGNTTPDSFNVVRGAGGGRPPVVKEQAKEVVELGKKFGLTDEEVNKFSQKAQEKKPGQ